MSNVDPDVMYLDYSRIMTHRKCPQMYYYRYIWGLRKPPEEAAPERDFGTWWQALRNAEALERGRRLGSLRWVPSRLRVIDELKVDPSTVTMADIYAMADRWWSSQDEEVRQEWILRVGAELPAKLRGTFDRWQVEWGDSIAAEEPLGVEVYWERELPKRAEGRHVIMRGYADEVYRDMKRNLVVVRDNKTKKSMPTMSSLDDVMDSQLQLYAWGLTPLVKSWELRGIDATSYDRTSSVEPKVPVLTKGGTLSKSVTRFDRATYEQWVAGPEGVGVSYPGTKKDGSGAGTYVLDPQVVVSLSTPEARHEWFQRTLVPVNANIVRTHVQGALDTAVDIQVTEARVARSGEAARCMTEATCKWCPYAALSRAQMYGGPWGEYDPADYGLEVIPSRR